MKKEIPEHTQNTKDARLARARVSLEGLSVGDAVGEALAYQSYRCRELDDFSAYRMGTLRYTDDTAMALALYETLSRLGSMDEDVAAWTYAAHFKKERDRGYGKMARQILEQIGLGRPWMEVSAHAFGGGSFGNGAAMRVAPLGAYFADDLSSVPAMAIKSARVTHYHPEGIAGAVAVAVAAAVAARRNGGCPEAVAFEIWDTVLAYTPESKVRVRLERAKAFVDATPIEVAREVGNGAEISAQDTVPFCIWNACRNVGRFKEAILSTIEVGGDCDTNAAIVGGILSAHSGIDGIPLDWIQAREALPYFH